MKEYAIIILLIILLTSCAPKEESQQPMEPKTVTPPIEEPGRPPIEEPPTEEPEGIITQEPAIEETPKGNTIEIKESSFDPVEKIIEKNTEIEWINKDKREHKIACYLSGTRVATSSNLKEEESFTYTFLQEGQYSCIDAIYGLRGTIIVREEQPLLSPTGDLVLGGAKSIEGASLAAIALIVMMLLLFFSYGKKRK